MSLGPAAQSSHHLVIPVFVENELLGQGESNGMGNERRRAGSQILGRHVLASPISAYAVYLIDE